MRIAYRKHLASLIGKVTAITRRYRMAGNFGSDYGLQAAQHGTGTAIRGHQFAWRYMALVNCGVVYSNPFRAMLDDVCELSIEAKE